MQENELFAAIADRIGPEKAQDAVEAIIANWGGEAQMIPNGARMRNRLRNQEIQRLISLGISPRIIAMRVGISERHVRRVVAAAIKPFPVQ